MYSSDKGWVYYDRKSGNAKQKWEISKTNSPNNSSGDKLYYGDQVKISNGNWTQANLGIKGKWLQCLTDDPTIWILSKKRGKSLTKK